MQTRREFLKSAFLLSGAIGVSGVLQESIQRALAIDPAPGSTFMDAEHVVILMQENRSFDHVFGALRGVRGFNDPRAIRLPNGNPVWLQTNAKGETSAPFRLDIKDTRATWMSCLPHHRASQVDAWNGGAYDRWLDAKKSGNAEYADLPLTLGYYNRDDVPFYYAMADAFTVCDQHFCGVMTSTDPNRLLFWTGAIRDQPNSEAKAHIRNTDTEYEGFHWGTFPEVMQQHGVSWKFYQNEIDAGGGMSDEERSWLGNFGCNPLEFFSQYHVKLSPMYGPWLNAVIAKVEWRIGDAKAKGKDYTNHQKDLDKLNGELAAWNAAQPIAARLSPEALDLQARAFTTNAAHPDYDRLESVDLADGATPRKANLPKGDVLHQFRQDVQSGKLPTVSYLAAAENFSDHPVAPWYGAWYVSEIISILTQNPEVWKKTIFILTYDENDGYFDHVPPFTAPDPKRPETGLSSPGIDTGIEYVYRDHEVKQGVPANDAREGPVGLGFRVPMIVASPWSRGGWVNSQVFDHTSATQFLEVFLSGKTGKPVRCENISAWRRAVSGDLASCFRGFEPGTPGPLPFVERDPFVASIDRAQFKDVPSGFVKLTAEELSGAKEAWRSPQEQGTRPSCALPYQLHANGALNVAKDRFQIEFAAWAGSAARRAGGAPFNVYAHGITPQATGPGSAPCATYTVAAGETLSESWPLASFADAKYHLSVHGPNGFFCEYKGDAGDPVGAACIYTSRLTNSWGPPPFLCVELSSSDSQAHAVEIVDNAYGAEPIRRTIRPGETVTVAINLEHSSHWYDFSVKVAGFDAFEKRYAGRVENGLPGISDPFMGNAIG